MKIRNIDHFVITTADLQACLDFYVGLLGMEHRESYDKDKGEQKSRHHVGIGKPVCNFLVSVFSSFHLTISAQRLL